MGRALCFFFNGQHFPRLTPVLGEWRYPYDTLGRRIAKQRHDGAQADAATWFVWDGLRLVQEVAGEHCVTIYEDAGS